MDRELRLLSKTVSAYTQGKGKLSPRPKQYPALTTVLSLHKVLRVQRVSPESAHVATTKFHKPGDFKSGIYFSLSFGRLDAEGHMLPSLLLHSLSCLLVDDELPIVSLYN